MPSNPRLTFVLLSNLLFVVGCGGTTDRLIAQLDDADPKVRRAAARALGEQTRDDEQVIGALSSATKDNDVEVREIAVAGLGSKGSRAAASLPTLEESLKDRETSVRVAAAFAIHKIDPQNESFVPVLTEALRSGQGPVFVEVGRMGATAQWAVPTLIALSSDRRASIRALAAKTLGQIAAAGSGAEASLRRGLRDDSPAVRNASQSALGEIHGNVGGDKAH